MGVLVCVCVCVFVVRYISVAGARRIELGGLVGSLDRLTTQTPPHPLVLLAHLSLSIKLWT